MNRIIFLTDYKGNFGSKWDAEPYRSGFDQRLLKELFNKQGYKSQFIPISKAYALEDIEGIPVLYTSSEDFGAYYKSYIEDVVYYMELQGANLIPGFQFLKAHNNKVFMELLRKKYGYKWNNKIESWVYGTLEEIIEDIDKFKYPIVIKEAQGAMSRGVFLANDKTELLKTVKKISRTINIKRDIKDYLRSIKHNKYKRESIHRKKYIIQSFIPNLENDWKVLVFGDKYFIFSRPVRNNDFRASGSGHNNYKYGLDSYIPDGIFDFARKIFDAFDVPMLSIDIVFDKNNFHTTEFQFLYFGTVGVTESSVFFRKVNSRWNSFEKRKTVEEYYVQSIIDYIQRNKK